jgi:DNA-directed RNA polymerase specialized sigma24 family protein
MTAALVSGTREWKWVLPTTDYVVKKNDPALTDDPEQSDEELQARKATAKTPATNGIPVIGLSVQDANDARSGPLDEATRNKRLGNAVMLTNILIYLRARYRKMTPDRAWDVLQDACVRALITQNWPLDATRMTPWLYTIARRAHVDDVRRRVRRENHEVLRDELDGSEAVTLPELTAQLLERIRAILRESEPDVLKGLDMLLAKDAGDTVEKIADDHGVSVSTAYELMKNARVYLKAHWGELVAAATIVFGMIFLLLRPLSQPGGASGGQDLAHDASFPELPSSSLRKEGLRLCERKQYEECLIKLNEAKRLDPAGEADPAVVKARDAATKALRP